MSEPQPNPYAPPRSALLDPEGPPSADELATGGRRFANLLVDTVAANVVALLTGVAVRLVDDAAQTPAALESLAVSFVAWVGYYTAFESLGGRTLGKLVTGTRVVSETGGPASFLQILGRSFARQIPFEALSFLSAERVAPVGWHDSLSRTRVVRVRRI